VVDELDALAEPGFVLLVVQLIKITVLRATHEYPSVWSADNGSHFDLSGYRHVSSVHLNFLPVAFVSGWRGGGRDADEDDGDGGAYDE
jgi:hypothetical protein